MISRNLFFKLQREDIKRRLWTIPLAVIVFFLSYPIAIAITLSNRNNSHNSSREISNLILEYVGTTYPMGMIITVVGAVICGMSGYYYVHSKKKVDFYHSIPVRREGLFAIQYLNGFLIYFVPYFVNIILSLLVIQIHGYMSTAIFYSMLSTMIVNTVFYMLIYTIVIIAMMLTGNIIVGCFGTGVFFLYGPMVQLLKELLFQEFFKTHYGNGRSSFISQMQYLSPLGSYYKLAIGVKGTLSKGNISSLLLIMIVTILLLGGAIYLYLKRPSESAGKAMAYSISEPIIKFAIVIAVSLGGGLIFRGLTYESGGGWFLFGILFSLIVCYAVIEVIYNFDIKSMFKHKLQLIGCLGITLVIAGVFQFDILKYDSYLPKKSEIASLSINLSGLEQNISYMDKASYEWGVKYQYVDGNEYQLEKMKLTDDQAAYTLALIGSKRAKTIDYSKAYLDNTKYSHYNIKYTLKNGKDIYEDIMKTIKELYMNPEYKAAHYPVFSWDGSDIKNVNVSNIFGNKDINLDITEKKELLESLKKDLLQFTIDELMDTKPILTLSLRYGQFNSEYFIYPSFKHTIGIIEKRGFDTTRVVETSDIISIRIENVDSYPMNTYSSKKDIEDIFPNLVNRDYVWNNSLIYNLDYELHVTATIKTDEYGNESTVDYYFRQDTIPDFVKKDMKYKNNN